MPKKITFTQFAVKLKRALKPMLEAALEGENGRELKISIGHFLIDGKRTQTVPPKPSAAAKYQGMVFSAFAEISASFYTLRDIEGLLGTTTSRRTKIMKADVLAYHVHNFLNENYILKLRLRQFVVKLLRASNQSSTHKQIVKAIEEALDKVFENIVRTRGGHVHDRRYTDDDLDRLSMLELMAEENTPLGKAVADLFKLEFASSRRRWLERMRANNDTLETLLDAYCTGLYPLIFDASGNIIVPKSMKGA